MNGKNKIIVCVNKNKQILFCKKKQHCNKILISNKYHNNYHHRLFCFWFGINHKEIVNKSNAVNIPYSYKIKK